MSAVATCKHAPIRGALLRRFSKCTPTALVHVAFAQTVLQRGETVVRNSLPFTDHIWLPAYLPGASSGVSDLATWFLTHPFWTLVAGTMLVTIIPRVTKALWRYVVGPIVLIGVGFSIGINPEGAASTARSLLEFGQTHPSAMSAAIVAIVAILITPYIIPLVLTGAICLFLWNPKALTNILPAPPPVPSWMLPAPLKAMASPKAWFQSLDQPFQQGPPTTDSSFNPIKRLAVKKDSPENSEVAKPAAAEKPMQAPAAPNRMPVIPPPARPSEPCARIPDLDTEFQVPRLAPAAAVSIPAHVPSPGATDSSSQAQQQRSQPLRGFLGAFTGSSSPDSAPPGAVDPPQACTAASASSEECSALDDSPAGLLQRARGLKPLEAMTKAAGQLKEAASDIAYGEAREEGVEPPSTSTPREEGVEPPAEWRGSRAALVKERLEQALPEKLRNVPEVGRWLPGSGAGTDAVGTAEPEGGQGGGDGGVEGGLGRLKSKVRDVKDSLSSEDSAVRRFGEKIRGVAGVAAAGGADAEQAAGTARVCKGETVGAGEGLDGAAEARGMRGFMQRARGKTDTGDSNGNSAQSGCAAQGEGPASERSVEGVGSKDKVKVKESVPEQKGDQSLADSGKDVFQVLGLLPMWTMFW